MGKGKVFHRVPVMEVSQRNRRVEFGLTMEGELEKLCSNISLTEGEKIGISVTEGEVAEFRERGVNCLVGKLWSEKAVNK